MSESEYRQLRQRMDVLMRQYQHAMSMDDALDSLNEAIERCNPQYRRTSYA